MATTDPSPRGLTMATPDEIEAMVASHFDGFTPDDIEASTEDCCVLAKELRSAAARIAALEGALRHTLECPWHCAAAHEARALLTGKPEA